MVNVHINTLYQQGMTIEGTEMILFLKDWQKYPNAVIHKETKNKSFVRIALVYKEMGVKNHSCLLALHNPMLKDLDPHDEELTDSQKEAIAVEIAENPWYFFREVIKIPIPGTLNGINFIANRANIAFIWLFYNHITTMTIMPRQTGKSVVVDSVYVCLLISGGTNLKIMLFTKDSGLRASNIDRLKKIMALLPGYLDLRNSSDSNNTENITVNALQNRLDTAVGQSTISGAMNVARGFTVPIFGNDETGFTPNIKLSIEAALPGTTTAREIAKEKGSPYATTFTTTPGYLNTESGKFAKSIYDGCCRWTEKFLDLVDLENLETIIKKNAKGGKLQVLIEFNHRQLGKTDEWLRERILYSQQSKDKAEAEYLNKWSHGSSVSPLSKETLLTIRNSIKTNTYKEITTEGYIITWFIKEEEVLDGFKTRYIALGLDSSEMIGSDNSAICGRDIETGETVLTSVINESNVVTVSQFISNLLIKYPNMVLVPEAKSTGVAIIDNVALILIKKGHNPFKRIFNYVVEDPNHDHLNDILKDRWLNDYYDKYRKEFGYRTSGSGRNARQNLYGSAFNASIKYTGHLIRDETIVSELESLIVKNGRIDHPKDSNDDTIISWLLPYWFLTSVNNKIVYGIDIFRVLKDVKIRAIEMSGGVEEELKKKKQLKIKRQIENYLKYYKELKNNFIRKQVLLKIKTLYKELESHDVIAFSLDELLKHIDDESKINNLSSGKRYAF